MTDTELNNVMVDYYQVFRIFEPYKFQTEFRKLNKISKIEKNKLLISQTEITPSINYSDYFQNTILPSYLKDLNSEEQKELQAFLSNQLNIAALLQSAYNEYTSEFYGNRIHSFLLHPIKYYKKEGRKEPGFINVQLKIYNHGKAILIFSTYEEGISVNELTSSGNNISIDSAFYPKLMFEIEKHGEISMSHQLDQYFNYKKVGGCKTIAGAINRYGLIVQNFLKDKKCPEYSKVYESIYISQMGGAPETFDETISNKFKRDIVQMMDAVPADLYTQKVIGDKYKSYSYGKYRDTEMFSNQFRTISVLSKGIIEAVIEEENNTIRNEISEYNNQILASLFTKEQMELVEEIVKKEEVISAINPQLLHLILLNNMKTNDFFILEFMLLTNLSLTDYNQSFNEIYISENKELKFELNRFFDWRNETTLVNSKYPTTLELFGWLQEKTEDVEKMRLINYNREFNKQINERKREITRGKLNIILSVLTFLISIAFSFEPISALYKTFGVTDEPTILRGYIIFNIIFLIILIIIYIRDIYSRFKQTKFAGYLHRKQFSLVVKANNLINNISNVYSEYKQKK